MKRILLIIFCALLTNRTSSLAQSADSAAHRNIIKMDITSHWLYRNALMFAYERTLKNKPFQSWGLTAGLQQFPALDGIDNIDVVREKKGRGFKLGAEYRFYLQKENKYQAPRGVYLGPYTTFHNYNNQRSIEVDNDGALEYAEMKTTLSIFNVGVQLGYQFIIDNRWAIDLVFVGPAISNYRFKTALSGNYTFDPDEISNEIVLGLMDQFPGFKELIEEEEFTSSGKTSIWGYGYRYQFQIGYYFGRHK